MAGPTQKIRFSVAVVDNYFTGAFKDAIVNMTHTLGQPKYVVANDSLPVPVGPGGVVPVQAVAGGAAASPSQTGFLLIYADGRNGRESDMVSVVPAP